VLKATTRVSAILLLVISLGGCIAVGRVDRRAGTLTQQVAVIQNRSVLLNLARASRDEPLYFMAMNQLSASGTTDFRFTPPTFFLGPASILSKIPTDRIAQFDINGSTFLDNATNTSFQMSLLGAKDFYNGLMGPITLEDVNLLLHQGYSRQLIFYLIIDKATISYPITGDAAAQAEAARAGKLNTLVTYNQPSADPADRLTHANLTHPPQPLNLRSYYWFQYLIMQALRHGLTTETYEAPDDSDTSTSDPSASPTTAKPAPPRRPRGKMRVYAELCYDRALADPKMLGEIDPASICGVKPYTRASSEVDSAPLAVTLHDPNFPLAGVKMDIEVSTRSIYQIFYALGGMIRSGANVELLDFGLPAETVDEQPLVSVRVGQQSLNPFGPSDCFSSLGFEGRSYCVPQDGADNTKRIFGILNALLALKQSVSDQPVTQTVRVTQ
jgi:hypothetical protein